MVGEENSNASDPPPQPVGPLLVLATRIVDSAKTTGMRVTVLTLDGRIGKSSTARGENHGR